MSARSPEITLRLVHAVLACVTIAARVQSQSPTATVPGVSYLERHHGDENVAWTVAIARGRGRAESSGSDIMFGSDDGDYRLFDAAGSILVRKRGTYYDEVPDPLEDELLHLTRPLAMAGADFNWAVSKLSVALDTLGPGDPIDGRPTTRYRIRRALSLSVRLPPDLAGAMSALPPDVVFPTAIAADTLDYWFVRDDTIPGAIARLILGVGATDTTGAGVLADLRTATNAAKAGLPTDRVAIRMIRSATNHFSESPDQVTHDTTDVSHLDRATVDIESLTLPAKQRRTLPPMEALFHAGLTGQLPATASNAAMDSLLTVPAPVDSSASPPRWGRPPLR